MSLATPDGQRLDAVWTGPPEPRTACVLCHPHPQHGGSMHNPLLLGIEDEVCRRGGAVLRFDFRGVGCSSGRHTGGEYEVLDVDTAVSAASDRLVSGRLSVGGWSFGGGVSFAWLRGKARPRPERVELRWFGVAPVLGFGGATSAHRHVGDSDLEVPRMAIVGGSDQFVSADTLRPALGPGAELTVLEECDHFFRGVCGVQAAVAVAEFVAADVHA